MRRHDTLEVAHPVLRRLFTELSERQLSWLLLRLPEDLAAPSGDVDLLVEPTDGDAVLHVAQELGFVALPGWEAAPNLLLVRYDRPSDRWLVLDIVSTIAFRPAGWRSRDGTQQVLSRRRVRHGIPVPADDDAFWLLLLHCLLDKGRVANRYRRSLVELAPAAARRPVLVPTDLPVSLEPSRFTEAVLHERWTGVEDLGRQLVRELQRRGSLRARFRAGARALRKPLLLRRRMGVSVALVGPNGVGKSTVARGVCEAFPFPSRIVYMGLWKGEDGGLGAALARPLLIWRRYLVGLYHRARGRLVVFDRYVYEAALPARPPRQALKRPYHWLLRHAVPAPDAVVLLDVPGAVAYGRKQENPPHELEAERAVYRGLASRVRSFALVDASRAPQAVRADVTELVWSAYRDRWQRGPGAPRPRRRARDDAALADVCALVPRILDGQLGALSPSADRPVVARARLTDTGTAIVTLARPRAAPNAVIKLPTTTEGASALRREGELLARLHADPRLDGRRRMIPRPLAAGAVLDQHYRIDAHLPGRSVLDRLADPTHRRVLLETAADAIHALHERTATTVRGDAELARRWVDARIADLSRTGIDRDPRVGARTRRLREELHEAVIGRTFATSLVHGDYWPGNLLFAPSGTEVNGIVDWDAADQSDLPMHDLLHLLLYTRSLVDGRPLGQIVRRELRGRRLVALERSILVRYDSWPPGGLPSYRHALLLYWLRHVALHARQHAETTSWSYRAWSVRNVHPVLGAL